MSVGIGSSEPGEDFPGSGDEGARRFTRHDTGIALTKVGGKSGVGSDGSSPCAPSG